MYEVWNSCMSNPKKTKQKKKKTSHERPLCLLAFKIEIDLGKSIKSCLKHCMFPCAHCEVEKNWNHQVNSESQKRPLSGMERKLSKNQKAKSTELQRTSTEMSFLSGNSFYFHVGWNLFTESLCTGT